MGQQLKAVKKVKNAVLYDNGMIRIDDVIGSYPNVLVPKAGDEGGEPKYSFDSLLPKDTHKEAIDLIVGQVRKLMTTNNIQVASGKLFIKDGNKWYEEKPECQGRYVVKARESRRPSLRDSSGAKLDPRDDRETIVDLFYGGGKYSVLINPWVQNNKFGKRINANLLAVRFVDHGEAFGMGRVDDEEIWDDIDNTGGGDGDGFDDDDDI